MEANLELNFNYNQVYYHARVFNLENDERKGYKVLLFKDKKPKIILIWSDKHLKDANIAIEWTSNNGLHDNAFIKIIFDEIEKSKKDN